jgi:phosphoglycerol transferase MdoB-like AlkP superfamily enzyme
MVLQKPIFMLLQSDYALSDLAMLPTIVAAGLSMDISMSAYLMVPVVLWLIARVWISHRTMHSILKVYIGIIAVFIAGGFVADAALYPFWKFHLDATPLFYVATAPGAAFASVPWWFTLIGVLIFAALVYSIYKLLALIVKRFIGDRPTLCTCRRGGVTAVMAVITALLIIPIRGGVTVSTMSPGRAYFCEDMRLNQAAVNPLFNFVHSLAHVDNLASQFRYYDDAEVAEALASLSVASTPDSIAAGVHLAVSRPDIYLIILESFSAHLMPVLGGEPIAMCLDSIARQGVLFTDFYAESFRTDRGLASILSGYPAMPTTSVFRYSNKFGKLPSLAASLSAAGYNTSYIYGGDINFTNMKAYLVSTGFKKIVKDTDFAVSKRLSKWGAHDDELFRRALAEPMTSPELRVVQTSSSHEPFEVPYHKLKNERANAFAFADSCLGNYVRTLKASGKWENALVVIVPDHLGAYPDVSSPLPHQHVPLVLTGGAIAEAPARISNTGSQSAIAPTLLALLGLDYSNFVNPQNLLDTSRKGYAWMALPEWYGVKQGDRFTHIIVNTDARTCGDDVGERQSKAFIQHIYTDLNSR